MGNAERRVGAVWLSAWVSHDVNLLPKRRKDIARTDLQLTYDSAYNPPVYWA